MFDFLKNLGKQALLVAGLMLVVFFIWPGATLLFFGGVVVGLVAGNLYQPLEHFIETQIAKR